MTNPLTGGDGSGRIRSTGEGVESEVLSWEQVDAILRHYVSLVFAGGAGKPEWQEFGGLLRQDVPLRELWICTVGLKLERCPKRQGCSIPVVEEIIFAEANAATLRNEIEERERCERRGREYFQFLVPEIKQKRTQLRNISALLEKLYHAKDKFGRNLYDRGMELLCREFGKCAQDKSFLAFLYVENR